MLVSRQEIEFYSKSCHNGLPYRIDDFNSGANGWGGSTSAITQCPSGTNVLGGYNHLYGDRSVQKTYHLRGHNSLRPLQHTRVRIEAWVLFMDSWDCREFRTYYDCAAYGRRLDGLEEGVHPEGPAEVNASKGGGEGEAHAAMGVGEADSDDGAGSPVEGARRRLTHYCTKTRCHERERVILQYNGVDVLSHDGSSGVNQEVGCGSVGSFRVQKYDYEVFETALSATIGFRSRSNSKHWAVKQVPSHASPPLQPPLLPSTSSTASLLLGPALPLP